MNKKICLIKNKSGLNAGDHLYSEKTEMLFNSFKNINVVKEIDRADSKEIYIDANNNWENFSTAGGPLIKKNFEKEIYNLNHLNKNIVLFGCGLKSNLMPKQNLNLGRTTIAFLQKCKIFTRDIATKRFLNSIGVESEVSGCSVWFNGGNTVKKFENKNIKKINISFHIIPREIDFDLVDYLLEIFPDAEITATFNCGFHHPQRPSFEELIKYCNGKNIKAISCKSDHEKLENIISSSDLQIGTRVHSHLCAISKGIRSLLVQVDMRGVGQSESLSLKNDFFINKFSKDNMVKSIEKLMDDDFKDTIDIIEERYNYLNNNFHKFLK